ncbi:MAG TPA: cation diffusion facilitator family transporter [Burkholderiales bacterium]|jgi:cobalt-zinc-cadmium efflux system protein|nr:cation diffusion facilitator family transporter [Burkholderiales bacterium]
MNPRGHSNHAHPGGGLPGLYVALGATAGFASVELLAGWWFNSLALLSDAGHMFSDAAALALAVLAALIARRPAGARHSYGLARAEVIAGFVNGLLLLAVVVMIFVEAVARLLEPEAVQGMGVAVVAALGLTVNLAVIYVLGRGGQDLNTRAATLHVFGDLVGSVAALTSGAVIHFTGWQPIDPLLSIVIALLILASTLRLVREALHVLMEGVPAGIQLREVGMALAQVQGVRSVHDLHIWTISSGQVALSAHLDVDDLARWPQLLEEARRALQRRFGIEHVTLQPEQLGGVNPGHQARVRILPRPKRDDADRQ